MNVVIILFCVVIVSTILIIGYGIKMAVSYFSIMKMYKKLFSGCSLELLCEWLERGEYLYWPNVRKLLIKEINRKQTIKIKEH